MPPSIHFRSIGSNELFKLPIFFVALSLLILLGETKTQHVLTKTDILEPEPVCDSNLPNQSDTTKHVPPIPKKESSLQELRRPERGAVIIERDSVILEEAPEVKFTDILPATAYIVIKDSFSQSVISNSTGFFIASDKVLTAAHIFEPLARLVADVYVISNSRIATGVKTYRVKGIHFNLVQFPCQAILKIEGTHTDWLPLSKDPALDGLQVRVISNSPYGFTGINMDGVVSRVFDIATYQAESQCLKDFALKEYNWYCDQDKFLVSVPTWFGASGSPVISPSGVVGTIEAVGPHLGTAIAASTSHIVVPHDSMFIPMQHYVPRLAGSDSLSTDEPAVLPIFPGFSFFQSISGFVKYLWSCTFSKMF